MKTTAEWVPVEVRLPPMEEVEYSDGSGTYFASDTFLVHTQKYSGWRWFSFQQKPIRMAWLESCTEDSEKQWYDAETGLVLPGVTHWLDGLTLPEDDV